MSVFMKVVELQWNSINGDMLDENEYFLNFDVLECDVCIVTSCDIVFMHGF